MMPPLFLTCCDVPDFVTLQCAVGEYVFNYVCTMCPEGYYCPLGTDTPMACDEPVAYCPAGSHTPTDVPTGFYATPELGEAYSGALPCEAGYSCYAGVRSVCLPGSYALTQASSCTYCVSA